jgi:predicted outer membrane protein
LLQVLPAVRFVRWAVLAAVLVAILVSVVLAGRSPSSPQSLSALFGGGTVDTPWGPLGASDRDMLIKVRQANLWEGPSGEQAAQRANSPAVREVGRKLGIEHAQLDADLRATAAKLGVPLPSQPSDQQRVWMAEITVASQRTFDSTFINLVRSAHGEVMPLVEGVRSGTQNQLVRQFAIEAGTFIGRHMDYLESTGLVDYALFPPSTAPAARLTSIGGYNVPITLVLFVVAVFVSAALLRGLGRTRPGTPPRAAGPGWWNRLSSRLDRGAGGGRRFDQHSTVTTAELIAVLTPPPDAEPSSAEPSVAEPGVGGRIPAQRVPSGPRPVRNAPARRPDELPVARSVSQRSVSQESVEEPFVERPSVERPSVERPSVELPVARSTARAHRVVRPGRSSAERTVEQDRRPPKLGRSGAARPW